MKNKNEKRKEDVYQKLLLPQFNKSKFNSLTRSVVFEKGLWLLSPRFSFTQRAKRIVPQHIRLLFDSIVREGLLIMLPGEIHKIDIKVTCSL